MKKLLSFTKKKKSSGTPDNVSASSDGYDSKEKDSGKIHKAALQGDSVKSKQSAKKNDVNQLDKENRTASHIACATGHAEVVQFLVDCKAKVDLCDNQNRSALMKAVQGQHERCVSILLDNHANPNLADINGNTALHSAANIPSLSTAGSSSQHGAEINTQNSEGFTPSTVAVREDRIEMAEYLSKEAADVNSSDREQRSPLMLAASSGQHSMVKLSLQFDPDISLQDGKGWSADDYAVKNGHHSCCLSITEYGTKRKHKTSEPHPGPSKKKKTLGIPFHDDEAGFSLGGPATDRDLEDNSLSESVSRASKSANDEWPSTGDEDESVGKKPLKVNLSRIFGSKMGEAPALPDPSSSDTESEPECETSVQRIPPTPTALTSGTTPLHPVDPPPVPSFPTSPHVASTPLQSSRKERNSTDDEEDDDREVDDEDEGETSGDDSQFEDGEDVHDASAVEGAEVGKEKKRDFRLESGLEKGEEDESSWDSESNSELSNIPHKEEQDSHSSNLLEETSALEQPLKETGSDGNRTRGRLPEEDDGEQKKMESPKRETPSSLTKPKEDVDIMEELGVGDVDDLEDGSDWDSASTVSKRTSPERKTPSSRLGEFREDGHSSGGEQKDDHVLPAASTPSGSSSSGKSSPSTPSRSAPQPQPRARKRTLQEPDGEESDGDPEKTRSSREPSPTDSRFQNIVEPQAVVEPGLSSIAGNTQAGLDFEEHQEKEKDNAVDACGFSLHNSAHAGPDTEATVGGDTPWEKRYEKLWVEVEKREVKSTFKSVAGELKEKFGELFKSGRPGENPTEDTSPASSSAGEGSSDEEDGEVIVRPAARARGAVLLTIPEQRESGQEESAAGSPDGSMCEERSMDGDCAASDGLTCRKSASLAADVEGTPLSAAREEREDDTDGYGTHTSKENTMTRFATDSSGHPHEAGWSDAGSEKSGTSEPTSQHRRPEVSKGGGYEEEDKTKRNPEIGREATTAASEEQKSCTSWNKDGSEKPETHQGEGSHQEQQPVPAQSTIRAPVQQSCDSKKHEKQAVEGTLESESMVRGARPRRAPQTSTHVNGDSPSVFDDCSLSDMSDDEERLTTTGHHKSKLQSLEEVDMAEDLDELTQSSDTATDDTDSPTSGYRHASLLIQKSESSTLDAMSITKSQNIFHEYERSIQKVRSRHGYSAEKASQSEMERVALKSTLEEVKDAKSLSERNQLELQTEVTNLKFQSKQEQENRHNASMMYNTTKDKSRRMEEQHQFEVQERQKVESTSRNSESEMRTLLSNMKQLEDEHSETQRSSAQERSSRASQENLLSSHLRKQQEMEVENKRSISRSNEALSQLTEASDKERESLQQTASSQEQSFMSRKDLEESQANSSLKESHLVEENDASKEQLEEVRRDLKLSNEAVTQTVITCNNQSATSRSESAKTTSRSEMERQAREASEAEAESTRSRSAGAMKEVEQRSAAHSDTEKALLREKEEHQRLKDRSTGELASQREAVSSSSQKSAKAEARANSMENEVHRVTSQSTEKGSSSDVSSREKEQAAARAKESENASQTEREQAGRAGARHEATQERLAQAQSEAMLLRQQLEEAQNKGVAKERAVTDAQERFSDISSKSRSDCEERVQSVEDRNKELSSKAADLRDQIYKLEEDKNDRETNVRQSQQELADSLKKLSMSEASLEVNTRYRNDSEEEKARSIKDCDRLRGKLEESEDQYVQAERHINSSRNSSGEREKELSSAAQKLQEASSASATSEVTIKQLEEAVQKSEIENARSEAAAKQQSIKLEALQKGAQEATMVREHLEDLVTNSQSSKMTLEDQSNKEVQKQSMSSHTAQDSKASWEEELKSRSKLGSRSAESEKEKGELTTQMDLEKKKSKKTAEQKKAVDARLDQEMTRNTELQKEMYRLRTLLKAAKKKSRDQEAGGAEFSSPMSTLHTDSGRHNQADGAFGWMRDKVDDSQGKSEKETSRRHQSEKANEELKDQSASSKGSSRSSDESERSKRQSEEEVLESRRRMGAAQADQSQVDQYRREAEEKARQEIQQKSEQVNLFLQSQAASQEASDQIKAANEANSRSQSEQRIRESEGESGRVRTSQSESLNQKESTRSELERYRQLYAEEMRSRKSLAAKSERANSRLSEANSKLLSERSRSLMMGNITNGSSVGPSLDMSSLASPANPGASQGPLNRTFGSGFPLLSPVTDSQNRRVEDYSAKMQSELDRNISKESSDATAESDAASARLSPVGSASRGESDPLSRATQQYLEVSKKNHRI